MSSKRSIFSFEEPDNSHLIGHLVHAFSAGGEGTYWAVVLCLAIPNEHYQSNLPRAYGIWCTTQENALTAFSIACTDGGRTRFNLIHPDGDFGFMYIMNDLIDDGLISQNRVEAVEMEVRDYLGEWTKYFDIIT